MYLLQMEDMMNCIMRRITMASTISRATFFFEKSAKLDLSIGTVTLSGTFGRYWDDAIYYTHTRHTVLDRNFSQKYQCLGVEVAQLSLEVCLLKASLQNSSSISGFCSFKKNMRIYGCPSPPTEKFLGSLRGFLGD